MTISSATSPRPRPVHLRIAPLAFGLLLGLTAANLILNLVAVRLGWPQQYHSFLPPPADSFSDFFKLAFSYPGGETVSVRDTLGLGDLLRFFQTASGHSGLEALKTDAPNHFHLTPLSTLIALLNLQGMFVVDPVWLFVAWLGGFALWWRGIVRGAVGDGGAPLLWIAFGLISYPMLFMASRGNVFAGIVGLSLAQALLLAMAGRRPLLAGLLLAVALNIRPNALLLGIPLVVLLWPWRFRFAAAVAVATPLIGLLALSGAHALYPDYTPASFLAGVRSYYQLYVAKGDGLSFNSSLYGALALMIGPYPLLDRLALLSSCAALAGALLLYWRGKLDRLSLLFISCAAYCLASTVFADYHLLAFLALPLALGQRAAQDGQMPARSDWVILLASVAILAPKHYVFGAPYNGFGYAVSVQSILNPAILCAAVILLFIYRLLPQRTSV